MFTFFFCSRDRPPCVILYRRSVTRRASDASPWISLFYQKKNFFSLFFSHLKMKQTRLEGIKEAEASSLFLKIWPRSSGGKKIFYLIIKPCFILYFAFKTVCQHSIRNLINSQKQSTPSSVTDGLLNPGKSIFSIRGDGDLISMKSPCLNHLW